MENYSIKLRGSPPLFLHFFIEHFFFLGFSFFFLGRVRGIYKVGL